MLYVIFCTDAPDVADIRAANRQAHLARARALKQEGRLLAIGPLPAVDAPSLEGGVTGSLIIAEFESLEIARDWASQDPYAQAGVFKELIVKPFLSVDP